MPLLFTQVVRSKKPLSKKKISMPMSRGERLLLSVILLLLLLGLLGTGCRTPAAGEHSFLQDLALVLGVAAVTTLTCHLVKLPLVLGYLLAGMIIGPYIPIPLIANLKNVHTLSEFGVIFLMFAMGLEFSLRRLLRLGGSAGLVALIEISLLFFSGYLTARFLGWDTRGAFLLGGIVSISSTMLVARSVSGMQSTRNLKDLAFGVLVFEDLAAVLLLAGLVTLAPDASGTNSLVKTVGTLAAFLFGVVLTGMILVPRLFRWVVRLQSNETLLVVSMGFCFLVSMLASFLGYSAALGAFLAGLLVAESGEAKRIEHLVSPLKDLFAGIFFVSVGMMIDPREIMQHAQVIAVITSVVVVGKIVGVSLATFLVGNGIRTALFAGFLFAQIGEFSFIIAELGRTKGFAPPGLYPVTVAVSALTTFFSPLLCKLAGPSASILDRLLPRPVQAFVTLYGTWIERLRSSPKRTTSRRRRLAWLILVDVGCLALLLIVVALTHRQIESWLMHVLHSAFGTRSILLFLTLLVSLPFCIGIVRCVRQLGALLAVEALPMPAAGDLDLRRAPRRILSVTLQIFLLLLIGVPFLALTQPFLSRFPVVLELALLFGILTILLLSFWRSAVDLEGHVQAGAHVLVETITSTWSKPEAGVPLPEVLYSGVYLWMVEIPKGAHGVGRNLAELNVRAQSGATVMLLCRAEQEPRPRPRPRPIDPKEPLREGDVLGLVGSEEAVDGACQILGGNKIVAPSS